MMSTNDVYNVYKRNGVVNNINSIQSNLNFNTKVKDESRKPRIDDNIINSFKTKHESNILENVVLLSNNNIPNDHVESKYYTRKKFESNAKSKSKSMQYEYAQVHTSDNRTNGLDCASLTTNNNQKDNKQKSMNDVIDGVAQNLHDVVMINNMSTNAELQYSLDDQGSSKSNYEFKFNNSNALHSESIIDKNVYKSELEREMELYEAFEKDEEARLINREPHDLQKEESSLATEPLNKKKRALEGYYYERKNKRNKPEQHTVISTKNEEDVCFICFDGGDLVLCDHRLCPKAYHLSCIGRDKAFFFKKGTWFCGSHFCSTCKKSGNYQCYTCPTSFCKQCVKKSEFCIQNKRKGICEECLPIVTMIEHNKTINNEGEKVDFEDKETYEYLFKEYWLELKAKHSIIFSILDNGNIELKNDSDHYSPVENQIISEESDAESEKASHSSHECFEYKSKPEGINDKDIKLRETSEENICENVLDDDNIHSNTNCGRPCQSSNHNLNEEKNTLSSSTIEGWASKELITFLEKIEEDTSKPLTKFAVHKLLWMYIKQHKLQNPRKTSDIICDKELRLIFGKDSIGQFEMFKLLNKHFPSKDSSNCNKKAIITIDKHKTEDFTIVAGSNNEKSKCNQLKNKRKKSRKLDESSQRPKSDEYAAINYKNISLIYLRRSILEEFIGDPNFKSKVVGTFVKIRVPGNSKVDSCYRLVLVIGTSVQKESYMVGLSTTNLTLLILNLQKKETITIDIVSNQDFTEEECERLRLNIKCGFLKTLTVGELEEKAIVLQEAKVNDWIESERQRLINLRDRASEKGRKKELRECVEKLQELNNPAFRIQKVKARPEICADPHMDPNYESDDGSEHGEGGTLMDKDIHPTRLQPPTLNFHSSQLKGIDDFKWKQGSNNKVSSSSRDEDSNKKAMNWRQLESLPYRPILKSSNSINHNIQNKDEKSHRTNERVHEKHEISPHHSSDLPKKVRDGQEPHEKKEIETMKYINHKIEPKVSQNINSPLFSPNYVRHHGGMPVTIVPTILAHSTNSMEYEKLWHYIDPSGTIQGPFSMEQLRKWNGTGLFPIDLRIWKTTEGQNQSILLTDGLQGKFNMKQNHIFRLVEGNNNACEASMSINSSKSMHNQIISTQESGNTMINAEGLDYLTPNAPVNICHSVNDVYIDNLVGISSSDRLEEVVGNYQRTSSEARGVKGYNNIDEQSIKGQIDSKMPCKFHLQGYCWKGKACGYWHN